MLLVGMTALFFVPILIFNEAAQALVLF